MSDDPALGVQQDGLHMRAQLEPPWDTFQDSSSPQGLSLSPAPPALKTEPLPWPICPLATEDLSLHVVRLLLSSDYKPLESKYCVLLVSV